MIIEMLEELNEKKQKAAEEFTIARENSRQNEIENMIWEQVKRDLKGLLKYSDDLDTGIIDPDHDDAHVVLTYFRVTDSFCIMPMQLNEHTGVFRAAGAAYGVLEKQSLFSGFKERPDSIPYKISDALCNWNETRQEIKKNVVKKLKIETEFLQHQTAAIKKAESLAEEVRERIASVM